MSHRIQVLPPEVAAQIAAGEVIERPASIVKELLENALDAGATYIKIDLKEGGKEEITVIDNGLGIPGPDVPLAFCRFATSKILSFDDLYKLSSFGFRGEALPSIASVARVEMVTRPAGAATGTKIVLEGGKVIETEEVGCPVGTLVKVSHLFDQVPARKKFLKSPAAEQGQCLEIITKLALGTDQVKIEVLTHGKTLLSVPAGLREEERIAILLGRETAKQLIPIRMVTEGPYRLKGFISHPTLAKTNSRGIFCFVNGRPVRDPIVNHALLTSYKNILPPGKYPVAIIDLTIPPEEMDVNVHPTKMEVRFSSPQKVYGLVIEGIIQSLSYSSPTPTPREEIRDRVEEAMERYYEKAIRPSRPFGFSIVEEKTSDNFAFLSQLGGTYLLFATEEGLVILDQHAAHERILFDRFQEKEERGNPPSQALLVPLLISLSPTEYSSLTYLLPDLTQLGFILEPFGPEEMAIKSAPATLKTEEIVPFLREILAEGNGWAPLPTGERRTKLIMMLACKGAITAHRALSLDEASQLFRELKKTSKPATCPHGRPTFVKITFQDLERMFKRR